MAYPPGVAPRGWGLCPVSLRIPVGQDSRVRTDAVIWWGRVAPSSQVLGDKADNKGLLFSRLDSINAVVSANPRDGLNWRVATKNSEARHGRSCSSMATETTHLHPTLGTSPVEQRPQPGDDLGRIIGDAEVRPIKVIVSPRRLPPFVQIEAIVRRDLTAIGVSGVKRNGGHLGAVRQDDQRTVLVHVERLMIVVGIGALRWFTLYVPVDLALRTCHYRACLSHSRIFAERLAAFDGRGQASPSRVLHKRPRRNPLRLTCCLRPSRTSAFAEGSTGPSGDLAEAVGGSG
jgi:hypothetical protein